MEMREAVNKQVKDGTPFSSAPFKKGGSVGQQHPRQPGEESDPLTS